MSKVIVIGGGAAGCMAAYGAALSGNNVILLEKNEKLGKKIYITGKGRCNFTNACDVEEFLKNVVSNSKFLYSALYTLTPDQMMDFIEEHGTSIKVERGNRAFPTSDHASDITKALEKALRSQKVNVRLNSDVKDLIVEDNIFKGLVLKDNTKIMADSVIICTGGLSYPTTGSTGDGLKFANKIGISITDVRPALVPLNCKEDYVKRMQGLSLKNVDLTIFDGNKKIFDAFGEMLFTHFGVSGPLVLSASSIIGKKLEGGKTLNAYVDLKPALSKEVLEDRILREFNENINKHLSSVLRKLLPTSMIDIFIELLEVDDKPINSITKEERLKIIELLKSFPFTIISLREFKEAIVTQGGVSVKEIDPSTMKSKKISGVSFAGEVVDVDAFTGGFNLQIAFSTGYLAGLSV